MIGAIRDVFAPPPPPVSSTQKIYFDDNEFASLGDSPDGANPLTDPGSLQRMPSDIDHYAVPLNPVGRRVPAHSGGVLNALYATEASFGPDASRVAQVHGYMTWSSLPWSGVTPEAVVAQERVDNYAVTNGVSRAFVSTVTIGQKTDFDIVTAPDDVLANPTYTMTRTGFQFLTEATLGVATGAAAKAPGWIGKAAFGLDTASNAAMFGEGVYNGDPLQAMFGAAGLSGNYADSIFDATAAIRNYRVRLDPDTLSSGPLPIGGLRIEKVVDNSAPNRGGLGLGRFAREMNADASTRRVLNQTRGRVFDDVAGQSVDGRFIDLQSEVTIRPFVDANGTLAGRGFRADRLGIDVESFATRPLEFKSSFRAPLTKGQRQGFPLFEQFGGQVRGHGGGLAFPQGTVLDPSNVLTIRPRDLPRAARIQFGQDLRDALIQLRSAQ